jgi:DHA2 family multidrug resistance protein
MTFASLQRQFRNDGTSLYSLVRNIGSSIGISIVTAYLAQRMQANHAVFSEFITPFNLALENLGKSGVYDIATTSGLSSINVEVNRQARVMAYLQDFRFMMWVTAAAMPIVFFLRSPSQARQKNTSRALESS